MFKKIAALATAAVLCAGLMAGCGASSTTADTSYSAENPLVLTLAHGLSEAHTVHIAMTQFAEEVNEKTDGRVQVKIFPNGQLGSENENLEPVSYTHLDVYKRQLGEGQGPVFVQGNYVTHGKSPVLLWFVVRNVIL